MTRLIPEVDQYINSLKSDYKTPGWLYALPVGTIIRADEHEDFKAIETFTFDGIFLDLLHQRICKYTNDLYVLHRGVINSAEYRDSNKRRRRAIPSKDNSVTVVTNVFPTVEKRGTLFGNYWATFD